MASSSAESQVNERAPDIEPRYFDQFPVREKLIYLNHAAVAPLPRVASDAMRAFAEEAMVEGSWNYRAWLETYEGVRAATGRMIGASPREIALVKNTSEGIATVAMGIDWRPGDRVVCFEEEFPANLYPWLRLRKLGVEIVWCRADDPLDKIDAAAKGARLVALSFVQYLTGYRADLNAIGSICKDRGAFFFVDAIQGLGAFPLDVRTANIGALAADGHKWLLGPEGCGILYVSRELQDRIEPVEVGWCNYEGFDRYGERSFDLRPDAGRYENGTLNTIGCYGLRASMEMILEIGVERIGRRVQALADRLASGAVESGYELLGTRTRQSGAGIVAIRRPGGTGDNAAAIAANMGRSGVSCAARGSWLRLSPHYYVADEHVGWTLDLLRTLAG